MTDWIPDADQLTTGLIRVSATGQILWLNTSAGTLLYQGQRQLEGLVIGDLIPEIQTRIDTALTRNQSIQISELYLPKSGLAVDMNIAPAENHTVLLELYPITERIRQRKQADRADRQQAISQMARHLAHELRNPLAGVKAGSQLISHQTQDIAIARHASMIERGVDRITALLERFADNQSHQKELLNLHQHLTETAELVIAERRGELQIETDFDPSIPLIMGDSDQLNQLFLNLLRNSSQAQASIIRIKTRIEHNSPIVNAPIRHAIRITFEDDGTGIPTHLHDRLFLPMVSGKDHGSGFGLAIAQQIARAHDGLIEFEPLERGSAFVFRLPMLSQIAKSAENVA